MRHYYLFKVLLFISILFVATSCVDDDYNWDNIDKEGNLPIGSLPIGDIKELTIKGLLPDDLDAHLEIDPASGILYLVFSDKLNINTPQVSNPTPPADEVFAERFTEKDAYGNNLDRVVLRTGESRSLIKENENREKEYIFGEPQVNGEGWSADVDSLTLSDCFLHLFYEVDGLIIEEKNPNQPAFVEIEVQFPQSIQTDLTGNKFTQKVNLNNVNGNLSGLLNPVRVLKYDYTAADKKIIYDVVLYGGEESDLYFPSTYFDYSSKVSVTSVTPDIVYGDLSLDLKDFGLVNDIVDFGDSFTENDILDFNDAKLTLDVKTNLGANFNLYIDKLTTIGKKGRANVYNIGSNDDLTINGAQTIDELYSTSFEIGKYNNDGVGNFFEKDLTSLFNILPEDMEYEIRLSNNQISDKKSFYLFNNLVLDADYTIRIPLAFDRLKMLLQETEEDVFDEDVAKHLFHSRSEIKIVADEVDINIGGLDNNLEIVLDIDFLDNNYTLIPVEVTPIVLNNTATSLEVTAHIETEDVESMKDAKHLRFNFLVRNKEDGTIVAIRETDSILMKKVKIKTNAGINYELD
jgi:hypothetical protein